MLLKRFYDDKLAQASYLIGCEHAGVALVVDPNRAVSEYMAAAQDEHLRIAYVSETHIHADFVSGAHDLAEATGAKLYLSDMGAPDWKYASAGKWAAELLTDGSTFMVGEVRIDVMHTPGHTPEHLTFIVTDTASANAPMGAFTGDFIFVGDVGRPDLLERAAGVAGSKESAARDLFRSLQRFKELPDYLQIWPGHGAGSACGKALGAMPQTTLGYEKLFNWGLAGSDEESFVTHVLEGQLDPPAYFAIMKAINRDGPPPRAVVAPSTMSVHDLADRLREGATVVDTRPGNDFAARHANQTISIPWTRSFLTWAGSVMPYDRDIYLIVADGENVSAIVDDLSLIGIDRVAGAYTLRSFADLDAEGIETSSIAQISVETLAQRGTDDGLVVLDVRGSDEWDDGHIPGALHIPVGSLQTRISELPSGREVAVHCQGGERSAIAASILQNKGFEVLNVVGGFREWETSGGRVESDDVR